MPRRLVGRLMCTRLESLERNVDVFALIENLTRPVPAELVEQQEFGLRGAIAKHNVEPLHDEGTCEPSCLVCIDLVTDLCPTEFFPDTRPKAVP